MEYCPRGNLLEALLEKKRFTEDETRSITRQLLEAIKYCNSKNIVHKDIKLENILLTTSSSGSLIIKLIDFGCSEYYKSSENMTEFSGSAFYIAPEVLIGSYNEQCDIWSIGVIAFTLVTGAFPFDDTTDEKIFDKIMKTKLKYRKSIKKVLSRQCRKFLK